MQKLFEFLLDKFESEELAKEEFLRQKLASIRAVEMTASELFAEAEDGGWDRWLRSLTLAEFGRLVSGPELIIEEFEATQSGGDKPRFPVRRPTDVSECIVDYLRTNPWVTAANVAEGIDLSIEVIHRMLGGLLEKKEVKLVGDDNEARYALM